jgi:hypothetical protein
MVPDLKGNRSNSISYIYKYVLKNNKRLSQIYHLPGFLINNQVSLILPVNVHVQGLTTNLYVYVRGSFQLKMLRFSLKLRKQICKAQILDRYTSLGVLLYQAQHEYQPNDYITHHSLDQEDTHNP